MRSPLARVLAPLARVLEREGVRWYLFGAQAALLYGAARLTADVDVTIDLRDRETVMLVRALERAGFRLTRIVPRRREEGAELGLRTLAAAAHRSELRRVRPPAA